MLAAATSRKLIAAGQRFAQQPKVAPHVRAMRENIAAQLREFWDAGIRGPDFVWAATGPAMEAYSKYPAVIKANSDPRCLAANRIIS